jgi:hypothetical protein
MGFNPLRCHAIAGKSGQYCSHLLGVSGSAHAAQAPTAVVLYYMSFVRCFPAVQLLLGSVHFLNRSRLLRRISVEQKNVLRSLNRKRRCNIDFTLQTLALGTTAHRQPSIRPR